MHQFETYQKCEIANIRFNGLAEHLIVKKERRDEFNLTLT